MTQRASVHPVALSGFVTVKRTVHLRRWFWGWLCLSAERLTPLPPKGEILAHLLQPLLLLSHCSCPHRHSFCASPHAFPLPRLAN